MNVLSLLLKAPLYLAFLSVTAYITPRTKLYSLRDASSQSCQGFPPSAVTSPPKSSARVTRVPSGETLFPPPSDSLTRIPSGLVARFHSDGSLPLPPPDSLTRMPSG